MPTYEYLCEACGSEFERVQRITEDANPECLKCGEPRAKRQVVSGNFILKGGGWYADLYSSVPQGKSKEKAEGGESKSDSKAESKPKAESKTKAESKSESKPATPSGSGSKSD